MILRAATVQDAPGIASVWTPVVTDSLITFSTQVRSPDQIAALIEDKARDDHAFVVAERAGRIAGFATYGQFRGGPGYAHTMEHTILLAQWARGQGVGRALMAALERHARTKDVHSLWAGVSAANPGGVRFHEKVGFRPIARLPEVGFKFGQWLDLILMHKRLGDGSGKGAVDVDLDPHQ